MSNGGSNGPIDPVPLRSHTRERSQEPPPRHDVAREADSGPGAVSPAGGAAGGSIDPVGVLRAWNAAVPEHMREATPPRRVPQGPDWPAVFAAVARSEFYRGTGRRMGPATLGWVLAHATDVMAHAVQAPPPKASGPALRIRDLRVGDTTEGGTCAGCNQGPMVFTWDGEDYAPDPKHVGCRA